MGPDLLTNPTTWDVLSKTGRAFFDALVEHLTNVSGTAVAFVVESADPSGSRVCPLASWGVNNFRLGRCYNTIGTPCERLRRGAPGIYPDRLLERFPADDWLQTTGMQGYVGLPLLDPAGNVLGHIGVLDDQPLEDPQAIAAAIEAFVPRCRSELMRARQDTGLARLIGSHAWVLYRAIPPQFAADMITPDGQGFLGFSASELAAYNDLRCRQLHEGDRQRVLATFANAMETGKDFVIQYRLWEKDRKGLRRFQDYGHVERDRKGQPTVIAGVLVDITTRREADDERRRGERQILSRLGDLPGLVFRCASDPEWTMQFVGGATRPLTGYGADELEQGRQVAYCRLIHADDRERVFAHRKDALAGKGYQVEYRLIDASGSEHFVAETGRRAATGDAPSTAVEGFIVDLTRQQTAQSALIESEERFRAISSAAQDAVIMVDEFGRIAFWNKSAERIFGYKADEVAGQEVHTLLAPFAYRAKAMRGLEQFGRLGEGPVLGQTLRLEAMRKDGSEFPMELSISSVQVKGRWHAIGIVRDIADKERSQAAARESEARFRALFDHAADGLLIADPVSTHFIAGNRRMAELLGYSREELDGLSVQDIHPPEDLPWVTEEFKKIASGGQGEALDVPVLRRDGSTFVAHVTGYTIQLAGRSYLIGAFRDITERRLAQSKIEEERQKLRLYLDNAPVVTVVFDIDGTVQMVNRRCCDLLGYSADEIVGRNWLRDFVPDGDRERMTRQFTHCFAERCCDCEYIEHPVQTRSGVQRLFSWRNEMIQDEAGQATAVLCSGEDVTERRRIEQDLRAARERIEFVVRTVPAVLYACEPSGDHAITFVGANLQDLFGIDPERVMGRSGLWLDYAHTADVPLLLEGKSELLAKGHVTREFRLRANGAGYSWAQIEVRLVRDEEGRPLEGVGYLLDISQRKEAEQILQEREASLAHAQAIAGLGSWETDLTTGDERWSDEVFRILGYAPRAFSPTQELMLRRIHPDDLDRVKQRLETAIAAEAGFNFDCRVVHSEGEERFVRARGEILRDEKGKGARILGTLLDFTERKQTEISLERSRQMLRELAGHLQSVREEERTRIAREIHDEMGQALTALKIDLVRLRSRIGQPDAAVTGLLESMLQGVNATIEAVQQLMAQLRPSILDNLGLIPAIEWQADQFAERTGIRCAVKVPKQEFGLSPEASTALFRILQESLTNVARHSGAAQVTITLARDNGWISLSIQDDGKGITTLEQESSRSFGLLGMRERAEVFGGQVTFYGKRGAGTRVQVCIPAGTAN